LTSTGSKKLVASPSSNQQGTWRVSDATTITTSRNAPSTLAISSSVASETRKDYTSSAPPWEGPFIVAKVTRPGSYRLQTLEGEEVTTRGTSTSSVGSTPSLHDYSGSQVYATTSRPLRRKRPLGPGTSLQNTPLL
jgi:hypothetical protein